MIGQGGIFLAAGDAGTSFISIEDIAAVAAAFEKEHFGAEYNLTGPAALDHAQAAKIISEASGRQIQYHPLTEEAMLQGARDQGMPEGAVQYMGILYGVVRNGWMAAVTGDVEKVIGRPPVSFGDFAQKHSSAWKIKTPIAFTSPNRNRDRYRNRYRKAIALKFNPDPDFDPDDG